MIPNAWLQAVICVGFFAGAVYETVAVTRFPRDETYAQTNGIGIVLLYLLYALVGAACLLWPSIVSLCRKGKEKGEKPSAPAPAPSYEAKAPAPAPTRKSKLYYLSHMKTFLTFIVVAFHVVCQFSTDTGDGLGTTHIMLQFGITEGIDISSFDESAMSAASFSQFVFGQTFIMANQLYFMSAFFFLSGIFCPTSLDRKGFRAFVLDKLMRLGGPFLMANYALFPLLSVAANAFAGQPLPQYAPHHGPTWFIFWLLNFSVTYAAIAQFTPTIKIKLPHPALITLGSIALGVVWFSLDILVSGTPWMEIWNQAMMMFLPFYISFFAAGIIAGRNGWLETIVSMPRWSRWVLRAFLLCCLALLAAGWALCPGFILAVFFGSIPSSPWAWIASSIVGTYCTGMTLALIQVFHEFFNVNTTFLGAMGAAAYAVYIIHPYFYNVAIYLFVEILKASHVPIVFESGPIYLTTDDAGEPAVLSGGMLWGGQTFVFVLTQLTVWPAAYYLRKLPVLNKML